MVTRQDKHLPPEPIEASRFLFSEALNQARQGGSITLYLPSLTEHAEQIVNQQKPLHLTVIRTEDSENANG